MYHWQISHPELQIHLQRGRDARAEAFVRAARRVAKALAAAARWVSAGATAAVRWAGRSAGVMHGRRRRPSAHCTS